MAAKLKIGDAVYVEWEDSCCSSGWKDSAELGDLEQSRCVSVGWVAKKTARSVTIAPHIGINSSVDLNQTNGHMMIPLCAIRVVRRLSIPTLQRIGA